MPEDRLARSPRLSARVLARLECAEASEFNPHLRDDYRIAWITVLNAARGVVEPHRAATYAVLGLHPSKVWPAIIERRKRLLGPLYELEFGQALPPKKPATSVRSFACGVREELRAKNNAAWNCPDSTPLKTC